MPSTPSPAAASRLSAYRESPLEFCEVASMTMELLGARRLDPFYNRPKPTGPIASCSRESS